MTQTYFRMVMLPVKVVVEHNSTDGLYYATVHVPGSGHFSRPTAMTVRAADQETAIHEALLAAGYGDQK